MGKEMEKREGNREGVVVIENKEIEKLGIDSMAWHGWHPFAKIKDQGKL
jgi:hypothetical protein